MSDSQFAIGEEKKPHNNREFVKEFAGPFCGIWRRPYLGPAEMAAEVDALSNTSSAFRYQRVA